MEKRLKAINQYYTNLEYANINRNVILKKIATLSKSTKFKGLSTFSERLFRTSSIIKKNESLFQSVCNHVDVVTTIIELLTNLGTQFLFSQEEKYIQITILLSVMLIIFNICKEDEVQSFLENSIIKDLVKNPTEYSSCIQIFKTCLTIDRNIEMILLEDADLYAVIGYLRITRNFPLNKIWVQKPIKEKFLSIVTTELHDLNCRIHVFQSKQELLIPNTDNTEMNIVSIWSEDIIAAKNLALSLNGNIIYINTHMDFYNICTSPVRIFEKIVDKTALLLECSTVQSNSLKKEDIAYDIQIPASINMFYDGMWQKPKTGMYYRYKDNLWPFITSDDVAKCLNSAKKGFEIWSIMSINSRVQVLSNFASTLRSNGKFKMANIISKFINNTYTFDLSSHFQRNKREVRIIYKPKGTIIVKNDNEINMFTRLFNIMLCGSSVIMICTPKNCSLVSYCNMFATSEIPPGVINILPSKNVNDIEDCLLSQNYVGYLDKFVQKVRSEEIPYVIMYDNPSLVKFITFPFE